MEAPVAAGIASGGAVGLYALMKCLKRLLGFKTCKYHSKSDNNECIFGCKATKRVKLKNTDISVQTDPELSNVLPV